MRNNFFRKTVDKLFGGITMSWPKVIIFAAAAAVVTAIFLIVPVFENTSFYEMGVSFEAWILFAVIIMINCEKPLESALKTFVFFLISQPLIYLFQVPFYHNGFGIFMYYRYWFIWTLLTFPMAFVGWFLRKKNWISLFVLLPAIAFLTYLGAGYAHKAIDSFPSHLLAALFCFGQIVLYVFAFFKDIMQRITGLGVGIISTVVFLILTNIVDIGMVTPLSDCPGLSKSAVVSLEDSSFGEVKITGYESPEIEIHVTKLGSTVITVVDGDMVYKYKLEAVQKEGIKNLEIQPIK